MSAGKSTQKNMENVTYAGFWKRFAATLIDAIILDVLCVVIILPILEFTPLSFSFEDLIANVGNVDYLISLFNNPDFLIVKGIGGGIFFLYYTILEASKMQATLGKKALGLKVLKRTGEKASFFRILLRNISKVVSAFFLMMGFVIAGFTSKKQGLHDLIARTIVVNAKK